MKTEWSAVKEYEDWHQWFAWYPVAIVRHEDAAVRWIWWETVYRRKYNTMVGPEWKI